MSVDYKQLYQAALNYLSRREHSRQELQQKLQKHTAHPQAIGAVLDELAAKKLLSDARFAEAYTRMRFERGQGILRIQAELQQRGVNHDLIKTTLDAYADVWQIQLQNIRRKKFGADLPKDKQSRAKQTRFLQQRGFTLSQITMVFRNANEDEC